MSCMKIGPFGGNGGNEFSDTIIDGYVLKDVVVGHGKYVDSVQCKWVREDGHVEIGTRHGGDGGEYSTIPLDKGETIVRIEGRYDKYVDQITFFTSRGIKYGPFGGGGGNEFFVPSLNLIGFFGNGDKLVDKIGFFSIM